MFDAMYCTAGLHRFRPERLVKASLLIGLFRSAADIAEVAVLRGDAQCDLLATAADHDGWTPCRQL
jgi:hypothetical protein